MYTSTKPAGYQKTRRHSDDATHKMDGDMLGSPHLWVKNALSAFESSEPVYQELAFANEQKFIEKMVVPQKLVVPQRPPPPEPGMPPPTKPLAPLPPKPPKARMANKSARVSFNLPKDDVESAMARPVHPVLTKHKDTKLQEVAVPVSEFAALRRELQETLAFETEARQAGILPSKQLVPMRAPEGRQVAPPTSPVSSFGGSPPQQSPSVFHWTAVKAEIKHRFAKQSNIWGFLEKAEFATVIGVDDKECAGCMYEMLLRQQHGSKKALRMEHLLDHFEMWKRGGPLARLRVIFALCDERGSGEITEGDLAKVLRWSAAVHQERLPVSEVKELASVLLDCCDQEKKGWIDERDFVKLLETADHTELIESIDIPVGISADFRDAVAKARRKAARELGGRSPGRGLLPRSPLTQLHMSPLNPSYAPSNLSSPKKNKLDLEKGTYTVEDPFARDLASLSANGTEAATGANLPEAAVKWDRRRKWGDVQTPASVPEGEVLNTDPPQNAEGFGAFNVENYSDCTETESTFWYRTVKQWPEIALFMVWMIVNISLFIGQVAGYRDSAEFHLLGYGACISKGAAEMLKFNLALLLLPVCRRIAALARNLCPRLFPSFEHNIQFHRVIGGWIVFSLVVHCGGHILWNFPRLTDKANRDDVQKYASWALDGSGQQRSYMGLLSRNSAAVTGEIMLLIVVIALPLASRTVRSSLGNMLPKPLSMVTSLVAFWHTHYLLLLIYPLVIVHGTRGSWYNFPTTTTWCWVLGPLILYAMELLLQRCAASILWREVEVTKAVLHAGGVLALHMARPPGFMYRSGMYIYLHCASASRFYWRPLWLMSCPSDNELVVHVKSGCEGSDAIIEKFQKSLTLAEGVQIAYVATGRQHHVAHLVNYSPAIPLYDTPALTKGATQQEEQRAQEEVPLRMRIWERMFPKVYLDGPFAPPTQDYKKYQVLVLIGVDFSVTYFTSIVKELLRSAAFPGDEINNEDDSSSLRVNVDGSMSCSDATKEKRSWRKGMGERACTVKKIYLVWSTQEQQSLTWFREEMDALAAADAEGVLELHQYLTALRRDGDARSLLLKLAQSLKRQDSGIDPATGNNTQVCTHFGAPHWDSIFRKLAADHPLEELGLFYSGPNSTSLDLSFKAREYSSMSQNGTRFNFHREIF